MGFGKVGSEVARRAKGLGMHVTAHDPYAPADRARAIGVELVSFDQAIATADFISLHMPLTPSTKNIFNDDTFAKVKKGVRIVNVARGGVIDEEALVRALDSGKVAQVCSLLHLWHSSFGAIAWYNKSLRLLVNLGHELQVLGFLHFMLTFQKLLPYLFIIFMILS